MSEHTHEVEPMVVDLIPKDTTLTPTITPPPFEAQAEGMVTTVKNSVAQHVPEIELSYRQNYDSTQLPQIKSPGDAVGIFRENWNPDTLELQEGVKVLFLNRSNRVLGIYHHSFGSMSGSVVDTRIILAAALKIGSSGIILCHNHPSGNLAPSETDKKLTVNISKACELLNIALVDHLILTKKSAYSIRNEVRLESEANDAKSSGNF